MVITNGTKFDLETDVLVIGYGFAGASAAITANDAGASVMIIEKMPDGGGNSRYSAGQCFVANPGETAIAELVEWLDKMCLHTTPTDVLEAFARGTRELPGWIDSLGGELAAPAVGPLPNMIPGAVIGPNFPEIAPSQDMFDKRCISGEPEVPPSKRLWNLLSSNVEARDIEVRLGTPAREILTDENGAVLGAVAVIDGEERAIRGRRAVVMTCGGFSNNAEMKWDFLPSKPIRFAGNPGNTGDGVRMAQRIGADLWHMTRTSTFIGYQSEEYEAAFCIFFPGPGFIWVDRYGRRYIDETSIELHDFDRVFGVLDPDKVEFPRIPSWGIFDEETRQGGALTWPIAGYNRETYNWSADNSAELERGWILKADSLDELAEKTSTPRETLEATLAAYNSDCEGGADRQFGRDPKTLKSIEPPFYAIRIEPVALNTQGGARRSAEGRVIDTYGDPIPNLFSAGEFGSIWGYLYPGGGNVTEAMTYGRIAGRNAAKENI